MSDLIKRLDNLAETLVESTDFSQYCQLVYEASAEIAGLRKDAERLDFLDKTRPFVGYKLGCEEDIYLIDWGVRTGIVCRGDNPLASSDYPAKSTWRGAIDAAIDKAKQ